MLTSIAFSLLLVITVPDWSEGNYCNIKTCGTSSEHTMCRYKSHKTGTACRNVSYVGLLQEAKNAILKIHNDYRQKVARGEEKRGNPGPQPAAENMAMMKWDNELETIAQRWANQCIFEHDMCRDVDRFTVGQNLGYRGTTGDSRDINVVDVIKDWYDEVKDFNKNEVKKFKLYQGRGPQVGHYTQFVWANTTRLGCGVIAYTKGKFNDVLAVCNYGPSGNWINEPVYKVKN